MKVTNNIQIVQYFRSIPSVNAMQKMLISELSLKLSPARVLTIRSTLLIALINEVTHWCFLLVINVYFDTFQLFLTSWPFSLMKNISLRLRKVLVSSPVH